MTPWLILSLAAAGALALYISRRSARHRSQGRISTDGTSAVDWQRQLCTCQEWRGQRARFKPGDPRRLCAHLCAALAQRQKLIPDNLLPFAPLIALMHEENTGIPFAPPAFAFVLGRMGYLVTLTPETQPWATVYAGCTPYSFNTQDGSWGDSGTPSFAEDIGHLVRSELRRRSSQAGARKQ